MKHEKLPEGQGDAAGAAPAPSEERCFRAAFKALERLDSVRFMWNGPIHQAVALLREATGPQSEQPTPAPSKGPPLTYDPNAYRSIRRDQTEAVVRAFCPDAVEAAELLDCITAGLYRQQDDAPDADLAKALEHLGQARFFLLRVPT